MPLTYDQHMAALCLWREARNQPPEVIKAVWHVLLNRVADTKNRWPKSLHQVVLQYKQFSSFNQGDPNSLKYPTMNNPVEWAVFQTCMDITMTSFQEPDPTKGANSYEDCRQDQLPGWADPAKITADIGPFRFYRL